MQAADFLAWEARKDIDIKDEWFSIDHKIGENENASFKSLLQWCKQRNKDFPYPRKSLAALLQVGTAGVIWNYDQLCYVDRAREHIWPQ